MTMDFVGDRLKLFDPNGVVFTKVLVILPQEFPMNRPDKGKTGFYLSCTFSIRGDNVKTDIKLGQRSLGANIRSKGRICYPKKLQPYNIQKWNFLFKYGQKKKYL